MSLSRKKSFFHSIFLSSSIEPTNEEDELLALDMEISEIDEEISRLRQKRAQLIEQREKLKNTFQENQRTTANIQLIEHWQRTGERKSRSNN